MLNLKFALAVALASVSLAVAPRSVSALPLAQPGAVPAARAAVVESSRDHTITLSGKQVHYRAAFEALPLGNGAKPDATISATSYVREPVDPARPVLVVFNGGPGASSSPLHFNGIGPWLQQRGKDGKRHLVANPDSLLDVADLVFIDPPGTGFSQAPTQPAAKQRYWSSGGDASAVHDFIAYWLQHHGRGSSPLFIGGESYGGYRLATLAGQAGDLHPAGLLLISPMLDASASAETTGNDLHYLFALPSMAVAAVQNGKVAAHGRTIAQVYQQAKAFALGDYALALMQGTALSPARREQIADKVAALVGLDRKVVLDSNLRLDVETYRKQLLADRGEVMGRLDTRVVAPMPKQAPSNRPSAANDPALGLGASNVIVSDVIGRYLREQVGVPIKRDYISLSLEVNFQWTYQPQQGEQGSPFWFNPTGNIAALLQQSPKMKLLVLSGYYDLAVPALAPWYALTHAGIAPSRMHYEILPSGHSVFEDAPQRSALKAMLADFVQ